MGRKKISRVEASYLKKELKVLLSLSPFLLPLLVFPQYFKWSTIWSTNYQAANTTTISISINTKIVLTMHQALL